MTFQENKVTLWVYPFADNDDDLEMIPVEVYSQIHEGDVTEIKVNKNNFRYINKIADKKVKGVRNHTHLFPQIGKYVDEFQ